VQGGDDGFIPRLASWIRAGDDLRSAGYLRADGSEDWTLDDAEDRQPLAAHTMRGDAFMMAMFLVLTVSHLSPLPSAFTRQGMLLEFGELLVLVCGLLPYMDHFGRTRLRGSLNTILDDYMDVESEHQITRMAGTPLDSPQRNQSTWPTQRTSRQVKALADMFATTATFLAGLVPFLDTFIAQATNQEFPVAECLGVDLQRLAGSDGLRDTLEMKVGEAMASYLAGLDLARARTVCTGCRTWLASTWLSLQRDYADTSAKLSVELSQSTLGRVAWT